MRRLLLILLPLLAAAIVPSAASAKRVALVVGIDQYENLAGAQQLQKAVSDARAVGETLRSLGYTVQQADNVGRLDFLRQWQQFLNRITPGDEAAFFFAGHGVEISGMNFLFPADVPRVASGGEELLKASALSLSELLDQTREKKPQMTLYVIDACRDNPFANSAGRSIGRTRGLTLIEPPTGTFVMFSAGAGESALDRLSDSDTNPNSIYTRTLLPRLKAPGRIGDIARDVRREVHKLASRVNHIQTPAFYDEVMGDFCPAGCMEAKVEPQPPMADPALEAWNETKATESVPALQAFVGRYPKSFYAELAKVKIDELKRKLALAATPPARDVAPGPAPDVVAWNEAKVSDNLSVLEGFIDKYPVSFYAQVAKARIEELKQEEQKAARQALVRDLQKALKELDCYSGAVDGVWSSASEDALERFNRVAKLDASVAEPDAALLDSIRGWKGERCAVEKIAKPETEKAEPVARGERKNAGAPKVTKTPKGPQASATKRSTKSKEVKKTSKPRSRSAGAADYDSPEKARATKKAGRTLEFDHGSVYCHQGCAGGFTGVLSGTARNSGMKR